LPSFALILVLAMMAFPDMIATSVANSQVAASWQQTGADAIITAPRQGDIPAGLQRQISSMPGVVSTTVAEVDDVVLPNGTELAAMFIDPVQYAAVADQAPGPRFPLAALPANTGSEIYPAIATPAAAQVVGSQPVSLTDDGGTTNISIQLAGQVASVPGVPGGIVVLVPQQALGDQGFVPTLLLVAGPRMDTARVSAAVRSAMPGGSVAFRATVLNALTTAPVLQAAQTALTQGMAAAAGFGLLVLLLTLLITARTREMTLARLATMGLRRRQAQLLLAIETLPPIVAAAVGGVACAWLLAPVVGPSLNLAGFSGTGSAIVVTPAVLPLAASAAGLVLAALLVLASSAVITYQRGSTRALRISE
jgi:putative ABC transport system permease protein